MINLTPNFTPTNRTSQTFTQKKTTNTGADPSFEKSKEKPIYNDPLMKWPIRGLAFTNDIGAAVMDIAPKLGTMLWYPAMMYFGADIYDKYRNNKETYDPNAKRGFQQAIFQALASVAFPIIAVHTGQKGASILARNLIPSCRFKRRKNLRNSSLILCRGESLPSMTIKKMFLKRNLEFLLTTLLTKLQERIRIQTLLKNSLI